MAIRAGTQQDLEHLVALFKAFFPVHNIFRQREEEVHGYLRQQLGESQLLVSETKGVYDGALFLVKTGQSSDGSHMIWKFRHFAFRTEGAGAELLQEAEKSLRAMS